MISHSSGRILDRLLRFAAVLWLVLPVCQSAATAENDGRWAILVAGISGEPAIQADYLKQIRELNAILVDQYGFQKDRIPVLFDDPSKGPGLVRYQSTREGLSQACRDIAARSTAGDLIIVFILGHGSFDGAHYKLNLVGPDPTAEELASMIYSIPARNFVVVNTTTCSGASLKALSGTGKVVITATKSGREGNQTRMSGFFVEALKDHNSDVDKNGRVSVLEAFNYAVAKVEEYYSKEGSLQTEHPVLDDNGDGEGHSNPGPDNGDGLIARTIYLDSDKALLTSSSPGSESVALAREAESLEKQIEALKYSKKDMSESEYEKKLEELLLNLARTNAKLKRYR